MTNYNLGKLILESAQKHQKKCAVILGTTSLTYSDLITQAQCVVVEMSKIGIKPGDIIVQYLDRSIDMIVGMVAIQLIGAVYCPCHPSDPIDRTLAVIKNVEAKYVLTNSKYYKKNLGIFNIINIDLIDKTSNSAVFVPSSQEDDPCYMVTTSGSTGKPKTLQISHFSVYNLFEALQTEPHYWSNNDCILQTSRCSFDVHILECYGTLVMGATVVMIKPDGLHDMHYLFDTIKEQKVTKLPMVPSIAKTFFVFCDSIADSKARSRFVDCLSGVEYWAFVGEPLKDKEVTWIKTNISPDIKICNFYGPAECTVYTTHYMVTNADKVFIGKPIQNYSCHIFDCSQFDLTHDIKDLTTVDDGELFIGGCGVMLGYVGEGSLELNKKVLVNHPVYGLLYRTGDIVQLASCGNLEFIGRKDFQTKINGQRLEIGEVENCIRQCSEVEDVIVKKESEHLVAYISSRRDPESLRAELKSITRQNLPIYMIPQNWVVLKKFPMNQNGKVDLSMLCSSSHKNKSTFVKPRNNRELEICNHFEAVFCREISVEENFEDGIFQSSLQVMLLLAKLRQIFPGLDLSVLRANPTISKIAALPWDFQNTSTWHSVEWPTHVIERYQATVLQKMFLSHSLLRVLKIHFRLPVRDVDIFQIKNIYKQVLQIFDIFRTVFHITNCNAYAVVLDCDKFLLDCHEVKSPQELIVSMKENFNVLYSERKKKYKPALRFGLDKNWLYISASHLHIDQVSLRPLLNMIESLLTNNKVSPPKYTMAQYGVLESEVLEKTDYIKASEEFWKEELSKVDLTPVFNKKQTGTGQQQAYKHVLSLEQQTTINHAMKINKTSKFNIFLHAFCGAIMNHFDRNSIIIQSINSGRWRSEMSEIVGLTCGFCYFPICKNYEISDTLLTVERVLEYNLYSQEITIENIKQEHFYAGCEFALFSDEGMVEEYNELDVLPQQPQKIILLIDSQPDKFTVQFDSEHMTISDIETLCKNLFFEIEKLIHK